MEIMQYAEFYYDARMSILASELAGDWLIDNSVRIT